MKLDNQQSHAYDENQIMSSKEHCRHEEGSSWASTPETRAREGVYTSFREDPQIVHEGDETHDEAAPSSSTVPATATQTHSSYDPYLYAHHDIYQHHQYDDYYLMDDYYYHDDYYPHLYYDPPAQQVSHQEIPSILPPSFESVGRHDAFSYRDHTSNWQEHLPAAEALISTAAAVSSVSSIEEHVQKVTYETNDGGSYASPQAYPHSDSTQSNLSYVYQTNDAIYPSEPTQPLLVEQSILSGQPLPLQNTSPDAPKFMPPTIEASALSHVINEQPVSVFNLSSSVDNVLREGIASESGAPLYFQSEAFEAPTNHPEVFTINASEGYWTQLPASEASLLNASSKAESLFDNGASQPFHEQPLTSNPVHHATMPAGSFASLSADDVPREAAIAQAGVPLRLHSDDFEVSSFHPESFVINPTETYRTQLPPLESALLATSSKTESLLDNNSLQPLHEQPLAADSIHHAATQADSLISSSLCSSDDLKQHPMMDNAPASLVIQHASDEARGAQSHILGSFLPDIGLKDDCSNNLLFASDSATSLIGSKESLCSGSSTPKAVLKHSEGKEAKHHDFETHGEREKGGSTKHEALELSERVVQAGAVKVAGAVHAAANQLLREDEDLKRIADFDDVVHDGLVTMNRYGIESDKESMIDLLLLPNERSVNEGIESFPEKQIRSNSKNTAHSLDAIGERDDAILLIKDSRMREKPEPINACDLFASRNIDAVSSKEEMLEKKPSGLKSVALEASNHEGPEKHLLDKDGEAPDRKKKPATERERALEKRKESRKAARKEKNDSKALSVVKTSGKQAAKGALLIGGIASSSTKKAIASRNEEIAVAMSTVNKTKKTVKGVKTLIRTPFTIYRYTKQAIQAVVSTVKSLFRFTATLTSLGAAGAAIACALFFLIVVVIVVLFATASIINDEQEVSEVSALVAELDAELTEDIQSLGSQPILYLDAKDTYGQKGDDNKSLTKNVDLADQESDLQKVVASSVTVQTDPGAIAAYIDAKYTGNWQVGAASWKYTIDAFGETWNVIEWDDMPEWAWKGLNKVNRGDFESSLTTQLKDLLKEEFELDDSLAGKIANDTADEFADVIFDNQIQGINEELLMQIIKDCVKKHKNDLDLTKDQTRKLYYKMQQTISDLIGEEDPFAFVYDEIVLLHERMNYWSEEYESFEASSGSALSPGTGFGGNNKYGYPNSAGYNPTILSVWDGYNEVSVYGISEAGTGLFTGDGTHITNTWNDTNMGIACEGLQNYLFAYWTSDYKNATGLRNSEPVKITLMNPKTGKSVTAEVIDCGGWRGFNPNYAGLNADRQWDLLPAVWKALGGTENAGTMNVYWKVDPDAVVGGASAEPKVIEDYPWPKETDEKDGTITITHPTLVIHGIQDALNNNPLMEEILDKDAFATEAEFKMVKNLVVTKVKDVMGTLLTMENSKGESYVDYNYIRRNLGDPFGEDKDGDPHEWIVKHRFNPGYEDFDEDEAYVEIKPLSNIKTVKAILEGQVEEIDDGRVVIRSYIDTANSSEVVYSELTDIKVKEGDEIKEGQSVGKMADDVLRISYYEINDAALQIETKKDWAYDPALYMIGFAGYEEPSEPEEHVGSSSDYSGCQSVVEFAYSRLGCPYIWGATGPNTFDCSGLTQWCYAKAGISIPRNSEAQHDAAAAAGNIISLSNLQPGDILWKPGHVGIYIGGNQYIHAPKPGDVVKVSTGVNYFSCGLRFS